MDAARRLVEVRLEGPWLDRLIGHSCFRAHAFRVQCAEARLSRSLCGLIAAPTAIFGMQVGERKSDARNNQRD
jgi:hypothetical protein